MRLLSVTRQLREQVRRFLLQQRDSSCTNNSGHMEVRFFRSGFELLLQIIWATECEIRILNDAQ
jgi:hypothetical protein